MVSIDREASLCLDKEDVKQTSGGEDDSISTGDVHGEHLDKESVEAISGWRGGQ